MATEEMTEIKNYLSVQIKFIKILGVWPKNISFKYIPRILVQPLDILYKLLTNFLMSTLAILFGLTFYKRLGIADFSELTYILSQFIIFAFVEMVLMYFQWKQKGCYCLAEFMNQNFRFRSAKGKIFLFFKAFCIEFLKKIETVFFQD